MPQANTKLSDTFTQFKIELNALLADYCRLQHDRAQKQGGGYEELWTVISQLLLAGGKRMRPYLVVQSYQMYGGKNYQDIMPVAAAQELLHVAMLIHDDIIDNDDVRYGILNIAGHYKQKYNNLSTTDKNHYASSAAILAGDVLLSSAYEIILSSSLSSDTKVLMVGLIAKSIFEVVGGEFTDMESVMKDMTAIDSLHVAQHKTAYYSFVGPLLSGAKLAGAPEDDIKQLEIYGKNLGIAFQLSDDLLGVYGNEAVTGKSATSDITEGKRTYLMQQGFLLSGPTELEILQQTVGRRDITTEQVQTVRRILIDSGAQKATLSKIDEYTKNAELALGQLHRTKEAIRPLYDLIMSVTKRDK